MRSSIGGWLENSAIMPLGRALITKKVGDEIAVNDVVVEIETAFPDVTVRLSSADDEARR